MKNDQGPILLPDEPVDPIDAAIDKTEPLPKPEPPTVHIEFADHLSASIKTLYINDLSALQLWGLAELLRFEGNKRAISSEQTRSALMAPDPALAAQLARNRG